MLTMNQALPNIRSEGCDLLAKNNRLEGEERIYFEEAKHLYFVELDGKTIQVKRSVTSLKNQIFNDFDSDAVIEKNMPNWANPGHHKRQYYNIIRRAMQDDVRSLTTERLEQIKHLLDKDAEYESLLTKIQAYQEQQQEQLKDILVSTFVSSYAETPPYYHESFGVQYAPGFILKEQDLDLVDVNSFNFWKNIKPNFMMDSSAHSQNFLLLTPERRNHLLQGCSWIATFYAYQRAKQAILDSWAKKTHCGTLFHLYVERLFNGVEDLTAPAAEGVAPLATFNDVQGEISQFYASNTSDSGYIEETKLFRLKIYESPHKHTEVLLKPYRTELSVWYEMQLENGRKTIVTSGQLDALMISEDNKFYLLDWKRTDHTIDKSARCYQRYAKLSDLDLGPTHTRTLLPDIDYNKYSLQLSLYACMLRQCFNIDVGDRMYLVQVYENEPLRITKCRDFNKVEGEAESSNRSLVQALLQKEYWQLQT